MLFNRNCCRPRQCGCQPMPMVQPMPIEQPMNGCDPMMEGQVVEPTITQCQEKEFYHEVPQV